jgi:hypothetical protein
MALARVFIVYIATKLIVKMGGDFAGYQPIGGIKKACTSTDVQAFSNYI